jgi:hypothetical protein
MENYNSNKQECHFCHSDQIHTIPMGKWGEGAHRKMVVICNEKVQTNTFCTTTIPIFQIDKWVYIVLLAKY